MLILGGLKTSFTISQKVDVKPDIVEQPSLRLINDLERGALSKSLYKNLMVMTPKSRYSDVIVRLKKVQILDIREGFGDKYGEVYLITSVADGLTKKPLTINIKTFERIQKNDCLDIGETGVVIYQNPEGKLPRYLDIRIQIVESDAGLKAISDLIKAVKENQGLKDIQTVLSTLATTANPMLGTVLELVNGVVPIIGKILEMNKDDQLCYYVATFTDKFDNLGVGLHEHTKRDAVKFSYEILAK